MGKKLDLKSRVTWLSEHLPYEVCMMRYSLQRMQSATVQYEYNMAYECFAVKARVLFDIFTSRDSGNLRARDFVPEFLAKRPDEIRHKVNSLNDQVFHPDRDRSPSQGDKIQMADCERIAAWHERHLESFLEALGPDDRAHWNAAASNPETGTWVSAPGRPTASATDPVISTSQTNLL